MSSDIPSEGSEREEGHISRPEVQILVPDQRGRRIVPPLRGREAELTTPDEGISDDGPKASDDLLDAPVAWAEEGPSAAAGGPEVDASPDEGNQDLQPGAGPEASGDGPTISQAERPLRLEGLIEEVDQPILDSVARTANDLLASLERPQMGTTRDYISRRVNRFSEAFQAFAYSLDESRLSEVDDIRSVRALKHQADELSKEGVRAAAIAGLDPANKDRAEKVAGWVKFSAAMAVVASGGTAAAVAGLVMAKKVVLDMALAGAIEGGVVTTATAVGIGTQTRLEIQKQRLMVDGKKLTSPAYEVARIVPTQLDQDNPSFSSPSPFTNSVRVKKKTMNDRGSIRY